jgi:hypothetical protein
VYFGNVGGGTALGSAFSPVEERSRLELLVYKYDPGVTEAEMVAPLPPRGFADTPPQLPLLVTTEVLLLVLCIMPLITLYTNSFLTSTLQSLSELLVTSLAFRVLQNGRYSCI